MARKINGDLNDAIDQITRNCEPTSEFRMIANQLQYEMLSDLGRRKKWMFLKKIPLEYLVSNHFQTNFTYDLVKALKSIGNIAYGNKVKYFKLRQEQYDKMYAV